MNLFDKLGEGNKTWRYQRVLGFQVAQFNLLFSCLPRELTYSVTRERKS